MVKLIPVLVSNSVSRNIIPGILKSIESYTMIYDLDKILDNAKKDLGISKQSKIVRNKLVIKEGEDEIVNFLTKELLQEERHGPGTKTDQEEEQSSYMRGRGTERAKRDFQKSGGEEEEAAYRKSMGQGRAQQSFEKTPGEEQETSYSREKGKLRAQGEEPESDEEEKARLKSRGSEKGKREIMPRDASFSIGQFDMKTMSLEPSWMKADLLTKNGEKYSTLIGVKAIPVLIKSDARLHELIMWDAQIGRIMQRVIKFGRATEGFLYRIWARTAGRLFNSDPHAISGNPYKDIVLKRTIISSKYVDKVYFVLNRADLKPDFFEKAKRVRQLTRLGWQSFIIADDVNRSVSFCMLKFRGMCATMPYQMIYQSLNQAKVFDDLEDVRRTSASLFRTKRPFKKIIGEGLAQEKLAEFSAEIFEEPIQMELLNEIELLDESFAQFAKKVIKAPKAVLSRILKKSIKLPSLSVDKLAKIGNKVDPDFYKSFNLAKKVIKNSLTKVTNDTLIDWAAIAMVMRGLMLKGGKNLLYGTREALKWTIPKIRKVLKDSSKTTLKVPVEHMFQVAFGTLVLFSIAGFISYLVVFSIRSSFEITDHLKAAGIGMDNYTKIASAKIKTAINGIGGSGGEIITKTKAVAHELTTQTNETAEQMIDSGQEFAVCMAILMIGLAAVLAAVFTAGDK